MKRDIVYRRHCLYAAVEITRHPVGRAEVELFVAAVGEIEQSRMLEKSADDAQDSDAVAHALNPRTQAADSAHDEIDFHSRLRRGIESLDRLDIHQCIHFGDDASRFSLA